MEEFSREELLPPFTNQQPLGRSWASVNLYDPTSLDRRGSKDPSWTPILLPTVVGEFQVGMVAWASGTINPELQDRGFMLFVC